MLVPTTRLLQAAQAGRYAIGAFNVYNLEGAKAVAAAAEAFYSPAMLQIHPSALVYGGKALIELCLTVARETAVPMAVHLDHSTNEPDIRLALAANISSVMADGSHLDYEGNVQFTKEMVALAHAQSAAIEAELGRISGTEDGLTVSEFEARFTDPAQAADFVTRTGVDALAVCIGNVHGRYHRPPLLDFDRLAAVRQAVTVPLVLHGASGLPDEMICRSIELGITKFNVNTEVRSAYLDDLKASLTADRKADLLDIMRSAVAAMQAVVAAKLKLFGSAGRV
ncbi:MAG: class II fructose-bisphosphate aldolase family protein [Anaerolineales bacterium]|nr:class II fructose-bisphosphate aldolase family protein [Anaerolineales bacterium]